MPRNKVVNLMDVPTKAKRSVADVQAFDVLETRKGGVTTKRHKRLVGGDDSDVTFADVPRSSQEDDYQVVYDDNDSTAVQDKARPREFYQTKNKGRGSIHVSPIACA